MYGDPGSPSVGRFFAPQGEETAYMKKFMLLQVTTPFAYAPKLY
jgi:hypothetical protein